AVLSLGPAPASGQLLIGPNAVRLRPRVELAAQLIDSLGPLSRRLDSVALAARLEALSAAWLRVRHCPHLPLATVLPMFPGQPGAEPLPGSAGNAFDTTKNGCSALLLGPGRGHPGPSCWPPAQLVAQQLRLLLLLPLLLPRLLLVAAALVYNSSSFGGGQPQLIHRGQSAIAASVSLITSPILDWRIEPVPTAVPIAYTDWLCSVYFYRPQHLQRAWTVQAARGRFAEAAASALMQPCPDWCQATECPYLSPSEEMSNAGEPLSSATDSLQRRRLHRPLSESDCCCYKPTGPNRSEIRFTGCKLLAPPPPPPAPAIQDVDNDTANFTVGNATAGSGRLVASSRWCPLLPPMLKPAANTTNSNSHGSAWRFIFVMPNLSVLLRLPAFVLYHF
uniref:G_PROTEIN_RECEP_F1_2 domain-containing protein n=1 Tax=Macrostomum lignano TaxID=282301 RepID=A0A1I8F8Y7_9PLAT